MLLDVPQTPDVLQEKLLHFVFVRAGACARIPAFIRSQTASNSWGPSISFSALEVRRARMIRSR